MRRISRIGLVLNLIAGVLVVGACAGSLFGPYTERFASMLASGSGRVIMVICLVIVALNLIAVLLYLLVDRPEPTCMRLAGNADIEVSTEALASIARSAAAERDVMVEDVHARVVGRDKSAVDIHIEAIALTQHNVEGLAHRVQQRVQDACNEMLGVAGARVHVRFLPSKTVTVTKEVSGER